MAEDGNVGANGVDGGAAEGMILLRVSKQHSHIEGKPQIKGKASIGWCYGAVCASKCMDGWRLKAWGFRVHHTYPEEIFSTAVFASAISVVVSMLPSHIDSDWNR